MDMIKTKLTYEQFEKCINSIIEQDDFTEFLHNATNGIIQLYECDKLSTSIQLLELIEELTNDKENGYISFWLYECEHGRKGEDRVFINKLSVPFTTIRDLWNVLIKNIKEE